MSIYHPYRELPARNFWKKSVEISNWKEVFQEEHGKFKISKKEKIATAGSCFAQRISNILNSLGYNFANYESKPFFSSDEEGRSFGYGIFSARYGNIYTIRQLKQLIEEAFEIRPYRFHFAQRDDGQWIDLLRPNINKFGFSSVAEAKADRKYHLSCVRRMLMESDIFIFTLGLTEAWRLESDGSILGTHPSVITRQPFPPEITPVNFDYIECFSDLGSTIKLLNQINKDLKYIFTVSPVALSATHQENHVLISTTYSKSILRAVAGRICDLVPQASYFPSYEIFNSPQSFGQYLSEDLRDVNSRGVTVAMDIFKRMYLDEECRGSTTINIETQEITHQNPSNTITMADIECEEVFNSVFK